MWKTAESRSEYDRGGGASSQKHTDIIPKAKIKKYNINERKNKETADACTDGGRIVVLATMAVNDPRGKKYEPCDYDAIKIKEKGDDPKSFDIDNVGPTPRRGRLWPLKMEC